MDDAETPTHITARQFAVLLILSQLRRVEKEIKDNDITHHSADLFRSQIEVWLQRTKEELLRAVKFLHDHDSSEEE